MQSLERMTVAIGNLAKLQSKLLTSGSVGFEYCTSVKPHASAVWQTPRRLQGMLEDGWRCHLPDSNSSSSEYFRRSTSSWRRNVCGTCISFSAQVPSGDSDTKTKTQQIYTLSNAISFSRLISAPGVAWLIASEQWQMSLIAITVAGASHRLSIYVQLEHASRCCRASYRCGCTGVSDLLDGYIAKSFNQESVLGSYLDPLADKAMLCACFVALGWNGTLSPTLVGVVLSRDALLVLAHFYHRYVEFCLYEKVSCVSHYSFN